jgi:DNA-binding MarR family transcriptional regulator
MATEAQTVTGGNASSSCLMGNLGWMLDHANHALACEYALALSPLGLAQRGFCVLQTAMDAERTQTQLAAMIGLDKTTMVVTVDDLERQGLAERVASPTDRRARVIRVTDAGRAKVAEGLQIAQAVQTEVLETLPEGEREAFVTGLMRLVAGRLSSAAPCQAPPRRREPRA